MNTLHSSSQAILNKLKNVYHFLPASQGRDLATIMDDDNDDDGHEVVGAGVTEGGSRGLEYGEYFPGAHVLSLLSSRDHDGTRPISFVDR